MVLEISKRIVELGFIPFSVGTTIQFFIVQNITDDDLLDIMKKERIFFMVRYILSKRLGDVISFKFSPKIDRGTIMELREVTTRTKKYLVDGHVYLDTFRSVLVADINILREEPIDVVPVSPLEEELVAKKSENVYEVVFYVLRTDDHMKKN